MFKRTFCLLTVVLLAGLPGLASGWDPPAEFSKEEMQKISEEMFARPDIKLKIYEDVIQIRALDMSWHVGGKVFEPEDPSQIPMAPEGTKIGMFLIHGGSGDHRSKDKEALFLASKFGVKVVTMTYPGRLYLRDPSRDWPGDTIKADGSVRTPIWHTDSRITRDQYDVVEDTSLITKYGMLTLACAKEGTEFYKRMSAWPVAMEETGKALMNKHLPPGEYSIYIHGHSTGGPFSFMFSQRVSNIAGVIGMESSPFGKIFRVQTRSSGNPTGKQYGDLPFNCLHVRTWRDRARYAGPEALMQEGGEALMRLPSLMDEVFAGWERNKTQPNFKAEGPIHFGSSHQLAEAARASAKRLNMDSKQTQDLITQYIGYAGDLSGMGVKPVPPVIFGVAQASADHMPERYQQVTFNLFAAMDPPPKVRLVQFKAGTHGYSAALPGMPMGTFPAVAKMWMDAITGGYYVDYAKEWATGK